MISVTKMTPGSSGSDHEEDDRKEFGQETISGVEEQADAELKPYESNVKLQRGVCVNCPLVVQSAECSMAVSGYGLLTKILLSA